MKTLLISSLLFLFISISFAQGPITQGTINLDGTISFSSTSYEGSDNSYDVILLNPQFGYFIVDNLSLGIATKYEKFSFGEGSGHGEWGIGPAARYYFNLEKVYPFIGLGFFYSELDIGQDFRGNDFENFKYNNFIISGGIDVFVAENVAIETLFNYTIKNAINPEVNLPDSHATEKLKLIFLGVGINIFIWVSVKL